jgi:hypothetical protein
MKLFILTSLVFLSAFGNSQNWTAKKSIEISSSQIAIDGQNPSSLKCPHQQKSIVGKLEVQSIPVELTCADDYMGGFFYQDEVLSQRDGDAGDSWETQSLLFFDKGSKSLILSLKRYSTYDTAIDCDGSKKKDLEKSGMVNEKLKDCLAGVVKCKTSEKIKKWDDKSKIFIDVDFKGKMPQRRFKPFEFYLKNCK